MNRMNPLFLKAFLTPSKNHANHCKTMLYNLNKNEVKSQTQHNFINYERHYMNMNTTKPTFTIDQAVIRTSLDNGVRHLFWKLIDEVMAENPTFTEDNSDEVLTELAFKLNNLAYDIETSDAHDEHHKTTTKHSQHQRAVFQLKNDLSDLGYRG